MRMLLTAMAAVAAASTPVLAHASSYVSGSFNIVDFGSASTFSTVTDTFSANNVVGARAGDFATTLSALQPITFNGNFVTVAGASTTTTPSAYLGTNGTDFLSVGSYQFDLTSISVGDAGGGLYSLIRGYGTLRDTNAADGVSPTAAWFTISYPGASPTTYSGSFYATGAAPVPLPASVWLAGSGLLGLLSLGRRRRTA